MPATVTSRVPVGPPAPPVPPQIAGLVKAPDLSTIANAAAVSNAKHQQALAQLDRDVAKGRREIMAMYKMARTPEEERALQWQLADLEAQKAAAQKAIAASYQQGQRELLSIAGQSEQAGRQLAQDVSGYWTAAGAGMDGALAQAQQVDGSAAALGVGGEGVGGDLARAGQEARENAASQGSLMATLGNIDADAQRFLAQSMSTQQAAQQGEMQRLLAGLRADATTNSYNQSNARIANETQQRNAALQSLIDRALTGRQDLMGRQADLAYQVGRDQSALSNSYLQQLGSAMAADRQAQYDQEMLRWQEATKNWTKQQEEQKLAAAEQAWALSPIATSIARLARMTGVTDPSGKTVDVPAGDNATPVLGSEIASGIQDLFARQYGLSPVEKRAQAVQWRNDMVATYGAKALKAYLDAAGITYAQLGL